MQLLSCFFTHLFTTQVGFLIGMSVFEKRNESP